MLLAVGTKLSRTIAYIQHTFLCTYFIYERTDFWDVSKAWNDHKVAMLSEEYLNNAFKKFLKASNGKDKSYMIKLMYRAYGQTLNFKKF